MAEIVLRHICKKFGEETIVPDLNLTIKDGSFTVLVGPSGCGKSTTLRMIAGLEKQTSGDIFIGGQLMNNVAPGQRDVAMVFQNYALYPNMDVRRNIEFGLINRKVPKRDRERLINEITEIVGLTNHLDKKPHALSGGQRQRVALARAMVKKPKVFIFDEPLSNLDAKLRNQMRTELIQLHKRLGTTFVYVTHDQVEAMSMGDEIVIMNQGRVQQVDAPLKVYHDPANLFTAQFIGTPAMNMVGMNHLRGKGVLLNQEIAYVGFRPEKVQITTRQSLEGLSLSGEIKTRETLGAEVIYHVQTEAGPIYVKSFLKPLEMNHQVELFVQPSDLYFFTQEGKRVRLGSDVVKQELIAR